MWKLPIPTPTIQRIGLKPATSMLRLMRPQRISALWAAPALPDVSKTVNMRPQKLPGATSTTPITPAMASPQRTG